VRRESIIICSLGNKKGILQPCYMERKTRSGTLI
jgi:hypothetical protein